MRTPLFYVRDNNPDFPGLFVVERYVHGVRQVADTFPIRPNDPETNLIMRAEAWRVADRINQKLKDNRSNHR